MLDKNLSDALSKDFSTSSINNVNISSKGKNSEIHASANYRANMIKVYAKNVSALVNYICPDGKLKLDMNDEIISGSMFTHNGKITDQNTANAMKGNN